MSRFIFRFVGAGEAPSEDVGRIEAQDGVSVLDKTPTMVLVEGHEPQLRQLAGSLPGWLSTPEQFLDLPTTQAKPRSKPKRKR